MSRPLTLSPLALAQTMAKGGNLVIIVERTSTGDVRTWKVYRKGPRLVYVGERVNEADVLKLVKSACGSTAVPA